jgi:hypothetical protein
VQEVIERAVPQLGPELAAVEVCERDEEVGERIVLALEESGQILGERACGVHTASVALVFEAS